MPAEPEIRVVYVEDDERLARLTTQYLTAHRVDVTLVTRGDHVLPEVQRVHPDVVLLDLMLPGADGIEVCRQLRQRTDVAKPFQSRELLARIRAQARRGRGESGPRAERIDVGALAIDATTMEVTVRGAPVSLTTIEFSLLHVLAQRAGRVRAREQLLQLLHGTADEAFDRSIDVVVSRVRAKIEEDPRNPRLLKTVRGVGYMLTPGEK